MTAPGQENAVLPARLGRGGWVHFGIAAGLLLVAAVGWNSVIAALKIHFAKAPVPPPPTVKTDTYQLVSFAKSMGPYALAVGDFPWAPQGVVKIDKADVLETLGVTAHKFDWYYTGYYRDTRVSGQPRHIRLDMTYYTGLLDVVPHVPEICLVAGGSSILRGESGPVEVAVPGVDPQWRLFKVYRTAYEIPENSTKSAQYYFFSVNGRPCTTREDVRLKLADLRLKFCYYAKIQFAPCEPEPDAAASDAGCRDFLTHALPEILRYLPSEADVERLKQTGAAKDS